MYVGHNNVGNILSQYWLFLGLVIDKDRKNSASIICLCCVPV